MIGTEIERELHVDEFQSHKKNKDEDWVTLEDELKVLASKAYPDWEDKACELVLNTFLNQISNPQVAFSVRQKHPETVEEAVDVTATIKMESYLGPKTSHICQVEHGEEVEAATAVSRPDPLAELL